MGVKCNFSRLATYLDGGPACASVGALTLRAGLAHVPLGPNSTFLHHTAHNIGIVFTFYLTVKLFKITYNSLTEMINLKSHEKKKENCRKIKKARQITLMLLSMHIEFNNHILCPEVLIMPIIIIIQIALQNFKLKNVQILEAPDKVQSGMFQLFISQVFTSLLHSQRDNKI